MFSLIGSSLKKYVDFQGRATRKEFWSFFLFFYFVAFVAGGIDGFMGTEFVGSVAILALFLPYLAVAVRRMNDAGKNGWFILIPVYNFILLCTPSKPESSSQTPE
jgi:uncharacterized membrane protein YhaH (DUF805 family)